MRIRIGPAAGYTLIELLFAAGLMVTLTAIAIPQLLTGLDDARARGAAKHFAARLLLARATAVNRAATVGIRIEPVADSYQFTMYVDGNDNGIRTADVLRGTDAPVGGVDRIPWQFPGVDFGVLPSLPPPDSSSTAPGADPIRLGTSNIISFTALGSSSSGSVYLLGRGGAQYAVRVFGETGRVRVLRFDSRARKWIPS